MGSTVHILRTIDLLDLLVSGSEVPEARLVLFDVVHGPALGVGKVIHILKLGGLERVYGTEGEGESERFHLQ